MKVIGAVLICILLCLGASWLAFYVAHPTQAQVATPNAYTALEARVMTLEGQVKELRRVVGIEGGLKEGLQNKKAVPTSPKK